MPAKNFKILICENIAIFADLRFSPEIVRIPQGKMRYNMYIMNWLISLVFNF